MSQQIKKFRPPNIDQRDLEKGIRYIENPPIADCLGFSINVGDIVCFPKGTKAVSDLFAGKVVGIYTKITPQAARSFYYRNGGDLVETKMCVYYLNERGQTGNITIPPKKCVKLNEAQYSERITQELLNA